MRAGTQRSTQPKAGAWEAFPPGLQKTCSCSVLPTRQLSPRADLGSEVRLPPMTADAEARTLGDLSRPCRKQMAELKARHSD